MATYGYARVSTEEQNIEMQIEALYNAGATEIYSEKISGASAVLPKRKKLLNILKKDDVLIIWKLDRLGRKAVDIMNICEELSNKGIIIKSLQDNIDTSNAFGKALLTIIASLAQYERELLIERTKAGIEHYKNKNGCWGRRPKLTKLQKEQVLTFYEEGKSPTYIANMFGVSRPTIYNILNSK